MNANVGNMDRALRIVVSLALVAWAIWGSGPWHLVGWAGVVLAATALVGWCPIYRIIGASTRAMSGKR
jgi:Protein of unknown function (DUF2892)